MKTIMRGLTLAAVLLTGAVTQAEFVVDDFLSSTSTGFADTSRTGVVTTSNTSAFVLPYGSAGIIQILEGATPTSPVSATWTMNVAAPGTIINNGLGWGYYSTLRLATSVQGAWNIIVTATNGVSPVGTLKAPVSLSNGQTVAYLDLYNLDHASNLNGLTSLTFTATAAANQVGARFLSISSITAVPEPATMSLLGLTAIGGIFAHRRRKNQLAA
jgi:hypothetical protein